MNKEGFWQKMWRRFKQCIICTVASLILFQIGKLSPVATELLLFAGVAFHSLAILYLFFGIMLCIEETKKVKP